MKKICTTFLMLFILILNLKSQTPQVKITVFQDSIYPHTLCQTAPVFSWVMCSGTANGLNTLTDSLIGKMEWGDGSIYMDTIPFINTTNGIWFDSYWNQFYHNYQNPGVYDVKFKVWSMLTGASDSINLPNYVLVGSSCDTISGNLYKDINQNCNYDINEPEYIPSLSLYYNDTLVRYSILSLYPTFMQPLGKYQYIVPIGMPNMGQYKVKLNNSAIYSNNYCPGSGSYTIASFPANNKDFGFQCLTNQTDVFSYFIGGFYVHFTNGNFGGLTIGTQNNGCNTDTTVVKLVLDPRVHITNSMPLYNYIIPSTTGDTVIWNNMNLTAMNLKKLVIQMQANTIINIGDTLKFKVFIKGNNIDANLSNNQDTLFTMVRLSWDPNDIQVTPVGNIPNLTRLNYSIRFQNTGNAAASKVIIIDTLDTALDINSIIFKGSSHSLDMEKLPGNVLKFIFDPIYLPDSGTSFNQSMGYLAFSISPTVYFPIGTQIQNTAYIYFDNNPAVITNTVINTIDTSKTEPPNFISTYNENTNVIIYPNPASDKVSIFLGKEVNNTRINIFDIRGKLIKSMDSDEKVIVIPLKNIENGIYTLQVINQFINTQKKIIISH